MCNRFIWYLCNDFENSFFEKLAVNLGRKMLDDSNSRKIFKTQIILDRIEPIVKAL